MSDKQLSNVPKKNDIIINPKTQRPIRVGSRVWLNLVKEGLVDGHYQDPNELYEIKEGDNVEEKIKEIDRDLPITVQSVRGRGKYNNKIVKRRKQPSTKDTIKHTARHTARKIKNPEIYDDLQESGNFEEELEKMIMSELAGLSRGPEAVRRKQPRKQLRKQPKRHEEEEDEGYYDEEEEEDGERYEEEEDEEYYE